MASECLQLFVFLFVWFFHTTHVHLHKKHFLKWNLRRSWYAAIITILISSCRWGFLITFPPPFSHVENYEAQCSSSEQQIVYSVYIYTHLIFLPLEIYFWSIIKNAHNSLVPRDYRKPTGSCFECSQLMELLGGGYGSFRKWDLPKNNRLRRVSLWRF